MSVKPLARSHASSAVVATASLLEWLTNNTAMSAHSTQYNRPRASSIASLPRLIEISQVGRRLILLGRHQEPIRAKEIALLADLHVSLPLLAFRLDPERPRIRISTVALG